jgi:O-antigen/teichoic acid export membrane protein
MSRTARAFSTYVTGVGLTGFMLVASFFSTPLLLRWLGDSTFGTFRLASDWLGYLALLEFGLGGALPPLIARALAKNDEAGVRALVATGVRAYGRVLLWTLGVGFLAVAALPLLLELPPEASRDLWLGGALGLLGSLCLPLAPMRALAEASQRGALVNKALFVQSLLILGASLGFARAGMGLTGQFLAVAIGTLFFSLLVTVDALRRYPGLLSRGTLATVDTEAERELRQLNRPMLVLNVTGRVSLLTDNIVVALLLAPALVVPLVLTQRLIGVVQTQLQSIGNASWAGLAELLARGEQERFRERVVELTQLIAVLSMAALAPLAAFNNHFVRLWVGGQHDAGLLVTASACVNAFCLALISFWVWCFGGTGQIARILPLKVAWSVLNLVASVVLTYYVGIAGPVLGTLVSYLGLSFWVTPLWVQRTFQIPALTLLRAATMPLLYAVPYVAGLYLLAQRFPLPNLLAVGAAGGAAGLGFLGLWWVFGFNGQERARNRERLAHVLRRRRLASQ